MSNVLRTRRLILVAGAGVVAALSGDLVSSRATKDRYIGSEACGACHAEVLQKWRTSHHAQSMQHASAKTVLGDFNGASLEVRGKNWRFFKRGEKFFVSAEGPDASLHDYEVGYTFGVAPLQQYLVAFPGGRQQALSVAWDTEKRRWFSLQQGKEVAPTDWLHWTRQGQNWNTMCADCHSTRVSKGFDPERNTFSTRWSEISVGCEACHGPGSEHARWAKNATVAQAPPSNRAEVERCAACHSRRAQFADQGLPGAPLMDQYLPVLLERGLFHADGQMLDEDFEYHSFTQSKMYAAGVGCTNCHDVHSGELHAQGNALCTRCHAAATFDTPTHHHHLAKADGTANPGGQCVSCHMPSKAYMVVHVRRDHSLRIPRPDLTAVTWAPSACETCHADKSRGVVVSNFIAWYGTVKKAEIGTALSGGRRHELGAEPGLVELFEDSHRPSSVRATALSLLSEYEDEKSKASLERALEDPEPLVRHTAVSHLSNADPNRFVNDLMPLLRDRTRAVRAEAASRLAEVPSGAVPESASAAYRQALAEYVAAQRYMSDMPSGPYNLGNLFVHQGNAVEAEKQYRRAIALDEQFYLAKVNLALLMDGQGRPAEAEALLREVKSSRAETDPGVDFDLGLVLAELHEDREAEASLRAALAQSPSLAPAAYNLAILIGRERPQEAVEWLERAVALAPQEVRYQSSLQFFRRQLESAAAAGARP